MLLFVADNASYLTEDALREAPLRARAAWGQEPYLCILVLTQGLKHNKCWTLSSSCAVCFLLHDRLSPEVACLLSPAPSLPLHHFLALSSHIVLTSPPLTAIPVPPLEEKLPCSEPLEQHVYSSLLTGTMLLSFWSFYFVILFSASCKFLWAETLFYLVCSGPNLPPFSK